MEVCVTSVPTAIRKWKGAPAYVYHSSTDVLLSPNTVSIISVMAWLVPSFMYQ